MTRRASPVADRVKWQHAFECSPRRPARFETMSGIPLEPVYGPEGAEFPGQYPLHPGGPTHPCTARGCGPCASSPASARPPTPTAGSRISRAPAATGAGPFGIQSGGPYPTHLVIGCRCPLDQLEVHVVRPARPRPTSHGLPLASTPGVTPRSRAAANSRDDMPVTVTLRTRD